jgi:hypothetical protein
VFSREGVPSVLVTDNGTHVAAASVTEWLKSIGCKHLFIAARHPCSNGQAENFVRTLKTAIHAMESSTFSELEKNVDGFLLQYRNAAHGTTRESPAKLSRGRPLRSNMMCLDSSEVTFYRGNDLRPASGIIIKNLGKRMASILDTTDLTIHKRHIDQLRLMDTGQSVANSAASGGHNDSIPDMTQDALNLELRRSQRIQNRRDEDQNHPGDHSSSGGCGD